MRETSTIVLNPKTVTRSLCAIALLLLVAHVISVIMNFVYGHNYVKGLVPLFDFAREGNVPTYFSSLLLLFNGTLFFIVWKSTNPIESHRFVWLMLSVIFCFLSLDEFAMLHDLLINPFRNMLGASGFFSHAWVIPYGIAVLLLAFLILPGIWRLGKRFIVLFFSSAACYLGGAIGVEMLSANYFEKSGLVQGGSMRVFQTFEESLEIIGLLILVHTLFSLIRTKCGGFTIVMANEEI